MTTQHQRFLEKIAINEETGCWLWQAYKSKDGYARFNRGAGISPLAHRYAYERYVAAIPADLELDHLCRVRHCVNPAHLEPVTRRENVMRGVSPAASNAVKTHCVKGHPFDEENTLSRDDRPGSRECRECVRIARSAWKKRNPEKRRAAWRAWYYRQRERQEAA